MIGFAFVVTMFGLGYLCAYLVIIERVEEIDKAVYQQIKDENRKWWNGLLETFKAKTTEQKIEELKKELEELEK